jgi:SepF-like predicted cell division protein (DUF552 family)
LTLDKSATKFYQEKQQLCLTATSIHDHSQLSELKKRLLQLEPIILIARIAPLALKDPEAVSKLVSELHTTATKNNYSVFRLGEERIIVTPISINVTNMI